MKFTENNLISILQECRKITPNKQWQANTRQELTSYTQNNPQPIKSFFAIIKRHNNIKLISSFASLLFIVLFSFLISPYITPESTSNNNTQQNISDILENTEINQEDSGIASFITSAPVRKAQSIQDNNYITITPPNLKSANNAFQNYIENIDQLSEAQTTEETTQVMSQANNSASNLSSSMGLQGISESESFEYALRMKIAKKLEHCSNSTLYQNAVQELSTGTILGLIKANEYVNQCIYISTPQTI